MEQKLTKQQILDLYNDKDLLADKIVFEQSLKMLEKIDFPTTKEEDWRKTDLSNFRNHFYELPQLKVCNENIVPKYNISGHNAIVLVFYNGFFQKHLSTVIDDNFVEIGDLQSKKNTKIFEDYFGKSGIEQIGFFPILNTLTSQNGSFILIKSNSKVEKPIHIYNFVDGNNRKTMFSQRNIIVAQPNSQANIVISFHALSSDFYFSNIANEIYIKDNAFLDLNIFEGEGNNSFLFNSTKVRQHQNSNFSSHTYTMCGKLVRNDLFIDIEGQNATSEINGLYLPDREQHFDNNIYINHKVGNCQSTQFYRGIIQDNSSAVFTGKVHINKNASKTIANQKNNNIVLSNNAKIHSKPQLIIENDDVVASHGSTVGQLDKEALFYMQARGISSETAKSMLLTAFANQVIEKIRLSDFRNYVQYYVEQRLKGLKESGLCSKMGICRG